MIREILERKAAKVIAGSRFGHTRVAKVSAAILDEETFGEVDSGSLPESLSNPSLLHRTLLLCLAVNAVSWLSIIVVPSAVLVLVTGFNLLISKGSLLLLAPAFGFTMFGAFSILRMWFPANPDASNSADVMSSYQQSSDSLLTWKLWVISIGISSVHAILLALTYLWMVDEF